MSFEDPFAGNEVVEQEQTSELSTALNEDKLQRPASERTPARVGTVDFKFDDPAVSVTAESNIVEQETINDTVVVQKIGELADQISIEGVVTEAQAKKLDQITEVSVVSVRTQRWSGDVQIESVDSSYRREVDREQNWLYDVTIEALEVSKYNY